MDKDDKDRDELAEEHKLLTKDNGIESSNYHFKAGFNACAEIFLKREEEFHKHVICNFCDAKEQETLKLQVRNEQLVALVEEIKGFIVHRGNLWKCEMAIAEFEREHGVTFKAE